MIKTNPRHAYETEKFASIELWDKFADTDQVQLQNVYLQEFTLRQCNF